MRTLVSGMLLLIAVACASSAHATFHLIKIREVFAGSAATRYVMLQMFADHQEEVGTHSITFFDAAGDPLPPTFTFPSNVGNDANQATILVGTSDLASVFGVAADFDAPLPFSASGGKICWDVVDCVSWGSYSGDTSGVCSNLPPPVCTPAAAAGGIPDGKAIRRRIDRGNPAILDFADDTGVGADDFEVVDPNPIDNGVVPTTTTTTTTNSGGPTSTTSTTLPCAFPGVDGARCVLSRLPPPACADATFPPKIPRLVVSADEILTRAQTATRDRQLRRLLNRAAAKLTKVSKVADKAGTSGKLSLECANALKTILDEAHDLVVAALPVS